MLVEEDFALSIPSYHAVSAPEGISIMIGVQDMLFYSRYDDVLGSAVRVASFAHIVPSYCLAWRACQYQFTGVVFLFIVFPRLLHLQTESLGFSVRCGVESLEL